MSVGFCKTGIVSASGEDVKENILKYTPRSISQTSYCGYQANMTQNLSAGQTYTVQLWDVDVSHSGKDEANVGIWIYWGGGSVNLCAWAGPSNFTNGHADYLYKTFTVSSTQASGSGATNSYLNFYNSVGYVAGTMYMKIGRWKLEVGSIPTPWCLSPQDTPYIGSNHGFIESGNMMSIYENYINTKEFIEY